MCIHIYIYIMNMVCITLWTYLDVPENRYPTTRRFKWETEPLSHWILYDFAMLSGKPIYYWCALHIYIYALQTMYICIYIHVYYVYIYITNYVFDVPIYPSMYNTIDAHQALLRCWALKYYSSLDHKKTKRMHIYNVGPLDS